VGEGEREGGVVWVTWYLLGRLAWRGGLRWSGLCWSACAPLSCGVQATSCVCAHAVHQVVGSASHPPSGQRLEVNVPAAPFAHELLAQPLTLLSSVDILGGCCAAHRSAAAAAGQEGLQGPSVCTIRWSKQERLAIRSHMASDTRDRITC